MQAILFGHQPVTVTREILMAMQPHQRRECLALLRERGTSEKTLGAILGVHAHVVRQVIDSIYHYRIPSAVEERPQTEAIPAAVMEKVDISRNAFRLLLRIAREKHGWTVGKAVISRETGIFDRALERAMDEVLDRGLIVKIASMGKGQAQSYYATEKGTALVAYATQIAGEEV